MNFFQKLKSTSKLSKHNINNFSRKIKGKNGYLMKNKNNVICIKCKYFFYKNDIFGGYFYYAYLCAPLKNSRCFYFFNQIIFITMKTNKNRINLLMSLRICLCVTLLAFASCKSCKKELTTADLIAQLPPETQTGANTFGCLIDGKAWIPNGGGWSGVPPIYTGGIENKFLVISAVASNSEDKYTLSVCINDYKTLGVKTLKFDTPKYPSSLSPKNYGEYVKRGDTPINSFSYTTTSVVGGTATITKFDEINGIISGTFEFDVIDNTTQKIISIKAGRFDVK